MSKVAGFFVKLNEVRLKSFNSRNDKSFAEPVGEFLHSRNVPLFCFFINAKSNVTHIGLGRRGVRSGTDLRRLNVSEIFDLKKEVSAVSIAENLPPKFQHYILKKIESGGLVATKSFEEFLAEFVIAAKETASILDKYSKNRRLKIEQLSRSEKRSLGEQKEAVLTAMNIAGINKSELQGWDFSNTESSSFLDGIKSVRLREDSMIINDLTYMPGFELMKNSNFSSSVFNNSKSRLTVLLANRMPLEELIGTDLIYYNEDFKCFVMVQYKVMEKEEDKFVFRLPNIQFSEEIKRMDAMLKVLNKESNTGHLQDFRISNMLFFIKICPRIVFNPDNVGLSKGMYLPLDYLKILQEDDSILGEKGGRKITYENVGRYFDNTTFKSIVEGGWIGTSHNQSKVLEVIIKEILENGRTAVVAIKKNFERSKTVDLGEPQNEITDWPDDDIENFEF
jgi:hypothetical protein